MTFGVAVARRDKPIYGFQEKGPAISNPICRDALKIVFDHLSLRETALTSRVSPSWHQTGKESFHDRVTVLRSGFEQPHESESQTLQALDLETAPKEIKKDLPSKAVQALDPAKSHQRKPKANKLSDVEFVRTKVQPDLKSAVGKICDQIKKLGFDQKLIFRVHAPHMPGFHFEGKAWMVKSNGLHREMDLVLEKKEETRQPLSDFSRDIKVLNKILAQLGLDKYDPNFSDSNYNYNSELSSTILPTGARLPVKRIEAFLQSEEGKQIVEKFKKKVPFEPEETTAIDAIVSELRQIKNLNKDSLVTLQKLICTATHARTQELHLLNQAEEQGVIYPNMQQVAPQATSLLSDMRTRFVELMSAYISPENFETRAIENRLLTLSYVLGIASLISEVASMSPSPEFILPFIFGLIFYQMFKDVHHELSAKDKYCLLVCTAAATMNGLFVVPKIWNLINGNRDLPPQE